MSLSAASQSSSSASGSQSTVVARVESSSNPAAFQTSQSTAETSTPTAAHASQLVHEIRDIGERISGVEKNSVEVRFDFNENERLSVRVEVREGTVHTTFRTDSPGLRDAIAQEWVNQGSSENRSFRAADPVFSSSGSGQQNQFSREGSESRQQAFASATPLFGQSSGSRGTSQASTSTPAATAARRPETSLHLHTFA